MSHSCKFCSARAVANTATVNGCLGWVCERCLALVLGFDPPDAQPVDLDFTAAPGLDSLAWGCCD